VERSRRRSLELIDQTPVERADAARNRQKILEAAARLVATEGAGSLSLDNVARAAGVGVGTVYRRFGDRAGLAQALIDEREKQFQARFMTGPPPLGPGAPPADRLRAFMPAVLDHLERQWELFLVAEISAPTRHYDAPPARVRHAHVKMLLDQALPPCDTDYLASVLMAALTPSLLNHQRRVRGYSIERIKAGLDLLLSGILAAGDASSSQAASGKPRSH
jgi:AcrR family transcriptional regulator